MRKLKKLGIILLVAVFLTEPQVLPVQIFASVDPSFMHTDITSKLDLRKYFEEAMSLFESGKYKEAVAIFEKLIEVEKANNEAYFTPFAEIYIEKSKARMAELMMMEEKKWQRMKKDVVSEAENIAKKESQRISQTDESRKKAQEELYKKEALEKEENLRSVFNKAIGYYRAGDYPASIVEFKKIKDIDPSSPMVSQGESYIQAMQREMKQKEQKAMLVKMTEAKRAKIEMEKEKERQKLELVRREREKEILKGIFEQRLKVQEARDRVAKVTGLMDSIIQNVREKRLDEAEAIVNKAIEEFPENEKFKDIAHYVEMQKIKVEESALNRARELTEEKMMLDVARKHVLPEEKTGKLETGEKIMPIVKIPEIRKRLKIPISVDFKDVGLDYVLSFLSDATGVNIVPSTAIDMTEKKVTMKIKDMPLEETLGYILKSQDLMYRIEEDAVWVATKDEITNEKIDTRVYFLNEGIGRFAEFTTQSSSSIGEKGEAGSASKSSTADSSQAKTVKDILESSVEWPKDSKLTLDERTGALIVSNTPSNLETIENLLYNLDITPIQVSIEARFLEVAVTDLDDIGLDWKLNNMWGMSNNQSGNSVYGVAQNSGVNFSAFNRADEGFNLTYQGILSNPQFQVVMHALQEKQNAKTLSAPQITTLNNQTATMEVVDEYTYPTRYEASLVQYDINGDGDYNDAGETEWINVPQDFVTRNVGIILHVKPSVGVDKKTITLALTPEVSEDTGTTFTYSGGVSIPNFTTRNLSTSVMVKNGETVVLGGLIKETSTVVKTKVPFFGSIPIIGGLFRKSTDSKERRNLLIFVTAKIIGKGQDKVASAEDIEKEILKQ